MKTYTLLCVSEGRVTPSRLSILTKATRSAKANGRMLLLLHATDGHF